MVGILNMYDQIIRAVTYSFNIDVLFMFYLLRYS